MVTVENVSRRYDDFVAVGNVSFKIGQGEIVGLLGHNGAGKTTIMKMLTGFLEPSAGRIHIDQYDIEEQADQAQQLIGYLPENLPVYPEMTVIDYLDYSAEMRGLSGSDKDSAVRDAIARTELGEKAMQPVSTLSRGYKQRVGVAQALLHDPKLLILDEPTNGLDPHQTQQMRRLILNLAKHATVILSTHIMQEVDALCDRVLILHGGALAVDESLAQLRRSDTLQLDTDAGPDVVQSLLAGKKAELVASENNSNRYHLPLVEGDDVQGLCAELASKIHSNGSKLFGLTTLQRDLETVFREISDARTPGHTQSGKEEAQDAA